MDGKGRGDERGCDIREGKPSILYAHAMGAECVTPAEKKRLLKVLRTRRQDTSDQDVRWVVGLYERCGAVPFATNEARRRAELGISKFEEIPYVTPSTAREFREIAEYVVSRKV